MDIVDGVREEFEKEFPVPIGVTWIDGIYKVKVYFGDRENMAWRHNSMLHVWRIATARAFGNGYRAGFRAGSGEVEQ